MFSVIVFYLFCLCSSTLEYSVGLKNLDFRFRTMQQDIQSKHSLICWRPGRRQKAPRTTEWNYRTFLSPSKCLLMSVLWTPHTAIDCILNIFKYQNLVKFVLTYPMYSCPYNWAWQQFNLMWMCKYLQIRSKIGTLTLYSLGMCLTTYLLTFKGEV